MAPQPAVTSWRIGITLSLVFQFIFPYPIHHTTNVFLESDKYKVNTMFLSSSLSLHPKAAPNTSLAFLLCRSLMYQALKCVKVDVVLLEEGYHETTTCHRPSVPLRYSLRLGLMNFFCKGLDNKYFKSGESYGLFFLFFFLNVWLRWVLITTHRISLVEMRQARATR